MSDMTAAAQSRPPIDYSADAIKAGIAHEAANGPAYVRIKALGMMAQIVGLYEQGKEHGKQLAQQAAQDAAQRAKQEAGGGEKTLWEKMQDITSGRVKVTEEMLGPYAMSAGDPSGEAEAEAEDEEASALAEDEPP